MSKRSGKDFCCVVGCHNRYSNTKDVVFYRFPNRPWEASRREKWISAVRRMNPDGTAWIPKKRTLICSQHFINGIKSNHPNNPAYVPTIFPQEYRKPVKHGSSERFRRWKTRREKKKIEEDNIKDVNEEINEFTFDSLDDTFQENVLSVDSALNSTETSDFSCQVIIFEAIETNTFIFEANHENNNVSTQAIIPRQDSSPSLKVRSIEPADVKDSETQTNYDYHTITIGYDTVKNEKQLSEIGGVTHHVFELLLQMIQISRIGKLSKENILLLFLMKMKLGLTFAALGYIFNVHRSTCSRTFFKVLHFLTIKTANFIFWPSKTTVASLLPEPFRKKYPKCRVIIDCSEVKIEEPPRADQRVFMYSSYKHSYTVKFLIGITPNGLTSFLSKCYGGRTSDGYIVNHSGFLDLLEAGDQVLADKGFPHIKTDSGAITVIPPILQNGRFSEEEAAETYNIASVRIHVERAIQRIKIYKILQKIAVDTLPHVNKIVRMCAVLANLQPPILKSKDDDVEILKENDEISKEEEGFEIEDDIVEIDETVSGIDMVEIEESEQLED